MCHHQALRAGPAGTRRRLGVEAPAVTFHASLAGRTLHSELEDGRRARDVSDSNGAALDIECSECWQIPDKIVQAMRGKLLGHYIGLVRWAPLLRLMPLEWQIAPPVPLAHAARGDFQHLEITPSEVRAHRRTCTAFYERFSQAVVC